MWVLVYVRIFESDDTSQWIILILRAALEPEPVTRKVTEIYETQTIFQLKDIYNPEVIKSM